MSELRGRWLRFEKIWDKEEARERRALAGVLKRPSGGDGAEEGDVSTPERQPQRARPKLQWDSAHPFGQKTNHSVDRRRLCLIPEPAWQEREGEDQGHQASCDETCEDKMTFEKMQTRMLNSATHISLDS